MTVAMPRAGRRHIRGTIAAVTRPSMVAVLLGAVSACGGHGSGIGGVLDPNHGASIVIDGQELTMAPPDQIAFDCRGEESAPNMVEHTKWGRGWRRSVDPSKWPSTKGVVSITVSAIMMNSFANLDNGDTTKQDFPDFTVDAVNGDLTGTEYRFYQQPVSSAQAETQGSAAVSFQGDMMIATGTATKDAIVQEPDSVKHTRLGTVQYTLKLPCINTPKPSQTSSAPSTASTGAASDNATPGAECSVPDDNSADGTLTCDGMRSIWLHVGAPIMQPGQPCARLGDVTATSHEGTVTCRQSDSGLTWQ